MCGVQLQAHVIERWRGLFLFLFGSCGRCTWRCNMYSIKPVSDGFVVINDRTEVRESEVYANLECAQEFMAQLAEGFAIMCGVMG